MAAHFRRQRPNGGNYGSRRSGLVRSRPSTARYPAACSTGTFARAMQIRARRAVLAAFAFLWATGDMNKEIKPLSSGDNN